jgi:primosomal protein N''
MKSKLIAMEPHRPQLDCHAIYVIAQQYSSATFDSLLFHSRKEKFFFFLRRVRKIAKSVY